MYLSPSSSSLMLRCFCCFNSTRRFSSAVNPSAKKRQLVFLGSPQVSASVIEALFNASSAPDSLFEVAAIVTQPPSGRSRGRKVTASPVAQHALDRGFPSDLIFTPERAGYSLSRKFVHRPYYKTRSLQTIKVKHIRFSPNKPHQVQGAISHYSPLLLLLLLPILTALQQRGKSNTLLGNAQCKPNQDKIKDHYYLCHGRDTCTPFSLEFGFEETFLSNLRALEPELCITAAYGNILPNKFLKIPPLGTVNLHPSVLPLYRGAAPVQRALQDGVKETGVSLAFTVRALDAGPVIACERMEVDDQIKAPDLLALLFSRGSKLLIHELPAIFDGSARLKAQPQEDSQATLAPKIGPEEAWLSFDQEAIVLHNKVRAFAGWPGTWARVVIVDNKSAQQKILDIKIITARVSSCDNTQGNEGGNVTISNGALVFPCGSRTALEVLELQIPGKRIVNANAFWNGLQGQQLKLQ